MSQTLLSFYNSQDFSQQVEDKVFTKYISQKENQLEFYNQIPAIMQDSYLLKNNGFKSIHVSQGLSSMAKKLGQQKFSYFESKIINNLKSSKGFIKPYGIIFDEFNTFASDKTVQQKKLKGLKHANLHDLLAYNQPGESDQFALQGLDKWAQQNKSTTSQGKRQEFIAKSNMMSLSYNRLTTQSNSKLLEQQQSSHTQQTQIAKQINKVVNLKFQENLQYKKMMLAQIEKYFNEIPSDIEFQFDDEDPNCIYYQNYLLDSKINDSSSLKVKALAYQKQNSQIIKQFELKAK